MAECGICLEDIKKPVCIPCGHVHCEKCLRAHINSGNDALKSSCPSCRSIFHIAMPDLSFVPKKYHDFMAPSVRKLYLDIASSAPLLAENEKLKTRVAELSRDKITLMEKCEARMAACRQYAADERDARLEAKAAQEATDRLQAKYDALEREFLDRSTLSQTSPDGRKRKGRESGDNSHISFRQEEHPSSVLESDVKLEEVPDVLESAPLRLKRALPRSSVASSSQHERCYDPPPRFVKRQRRTRHSDIGPGLQIQMLEQCEGCGKCHGIYSQ